jgi:hypothetical protein
MKVWLDTDEAYPVIYSMKDMGRLVEVPDDLWKKFLKTEDEYHNLHADLLALFEGAGK